MPRVMQVSIPISRTPSTMATSVSMSRSLGDRQAAPMQNRVEPSALALRAADSTRSTSISLEAGKCEPLRADWLQ